MKKFDLSTDDFRNYLEEVRDDIEKPFDCPHLIVLPEYVNSKTRNFYIQYDENSLICFPKGGFVDKCGIREVSRVNKSGELEVKCKCGNELKFKVTDFNQV